jgi:hypothetical protein
LPFKDKASDERNRTKLTEGSYISSQMGTRRGNVGANQAPNWEDVGYGHL